MGNHHDDCGCRCPFEAMHSTSSPSHDSACFRRMHTLTAGCAILSLLCAARSAAADAIDWNAMLSPGSVKYSGFLCAHNTSQCKYRSHIEVHCFKAYQ